MQNVIFLNFIDTDELKYKQHFDEVEKILTY